MREELLTELHSPRAGRVWPRRSRWSSSPATLDEEGRRPIVDKESARRRTPRATRRIKEECEAELSVAEAIPSLWTRQSRRSPSCEEG